MVLGVPNNRLTCMQGQKHFHCLVICIYFLPYLINDSQAICLTIHFSKPLLCMTLIRLVYFYFHFIIKASFVRAVLLCLQPLPGKQLFWHLVAKNEFVFHSDQGEKTSKWTGNLLIFHFNINKNRLGIHFNDSESTVSFERQ